MKTKKSRDIVLKNICIKLDVNCKVFNLELMTHSALHIHNGHTITESLNHNHATPFSGGVKIQKKSFNSIGQNNIVYSHTMTLSFLKYRYWCIRLWWMESNFLAPITCNEGKIVKFKSLTWTINFTLYEHNVKIISNAVLLLRTSPCAHLTIFKLPYTLNKSTNLYL